MSGLQKKRMLGFGLALFIALIGFGIFYFWPLQTMQTLSQKTELDQAELVLELTPSSTDGSANYFYNSDRADQFYKTVQQSTPELAPYVLRLNSRAFLPLAISGERGLALLAKIFKTQPDQKRRLYLQFKTHPTLEQRQTLSNAGIQLESYVTAYAWSASGTRAAFECVLNLPFVRAAESIDARDKLLPDVYRRQVPSFAQLDDGRVRFWVLAQPQVDTDVFSAALKSLPQASSAIKSSDVNVQARLAYTSSLGLQFEVLADPNLAEALGALDAVAYVEYSPPPAQSRDGVTDEIHNVIDVRDTGLFLTGSGVTVAVREIGKPAAHLGFSTRLTYTQSGQTTPSSEVDHATGVVGLVAGDGTSGVKGVATATSVVMYAVNDTSGDSFGTADLVDSLSKGARISNHSYGPSSDFGFGEYRTISADWDNALRLNNLTGFFANYEAGTAPAIKTTDYFVGAKNTICVNSASSAAHAFDASPSTPASNGNSSFNGKGTMNDGRVKPDLTAYGEGVSLCQGISSTTLKSGTSFSTPTCTGGAALISQHYFNKTGAYPSAALLKALLCNSATDLGTVGPDPYYGFGLLNVEEAVNTVSLRESTSVGPFYEGSLVNTETQQFTATVSGSTQFKATLCWMDLGGSPSVSTPVLVNDLDMEVIAPDGVTKYYPYSLNATDPTIAAANTARNTVDPIEQVVINTPANGTYTIVIRGLSIPSGTQAFAVVLNQSTTPQPLNVNLIASPTEGDAPLAVGCSGASSTGSISGYAWDFGDTTLGSGAQVIHTYDTPGTYTITLTIKEGSGASKTATQIIKVNRPTQTVFADKMLLKLDFAKTEKDSLILKVVVPSRVKTRLQIKQIQTKIRNEELDPEVLILRINGIDIETFTTDLRGSAKTKTSSLKQNMLKGEITIALKNRTDLQAVFKLLNMTSSPASTGTKDIPVVIDSTNGLYSTTFKPYYENNNSVNGAAKQ